MTSRSGIARVVAPGRLEMDCLAAGTLAAEVRQRIENRLAAWGYGRRADDACLIAAELISNACTETPDGKIRIRCSKEPTFVLIAVWDSSDEMPQRQPTLDLALDKLDLSPENFDDNGGWGLLLVQNLSIEYGVEKTRPFGKWVWAKLAL